MLTYFQELGNLKTALDDLKQAKTKANEAMANFEGVNKTKMTINYQFNL